MKSRPSIAIIGTGRMARALGFLLSPVAAIGGRCPQSARDASVYIGCERSVALRDVGLHASHILIAVSDDAVSEVAGALLSARLMNATVLHVSAAAGPEALGTLRQFGNSVGVLHPLQTVPSPERGIESLPGAAYAIAGDSAAVAWARSLVERLRGRIILVESDRWRLYHAGAVMASNYNVTLVDAALELMETAGIPRDEALTALEPLIRATMENVLVCGPEKALTGPVRRGDVGTVYHHLKALACVAPETRRLYAAAALRTVPLAQRAGLPAQAADELTRTIDGTE